MKSKREQRISYSEFAYEPLQQGISLGSGAVGEIRLNLIESQLEITQTENCLNALSAKFALKEVSLHAPRLGILIY